MKKAEVENLLTRFHEKYVLHVAFKSMYKNNMSGKFNFTADWTKSHFHLSKNLRLVRKHYFALALFYEALTGAAPFWWSRSSIEMRRRLHFWQRPFSLLFNWTPTKTNKKICTVHNRSISIFVNWENICKHWYELFGLKRYKFRLNPCRAASIFFLWVSNNINNDKHYAANSAIRTAPMFIISKS
jgi:hypothetical protein